MNGEIEYTCTVCGKKHIGIPAIACDRPASYYVARKAGCENIFETNDLCVIDDETFLVRAVLDLPIIGHPTTFQFGLWGSLSEKNYLRYQKTYDDQDQSKLGAMFSYLDNDLTQYPGCRGLHCNLIAQDNRLRPQIVLRPDQDHPLVHDQINGITLDRAVELVTHALHPRED